MQDYPGTLQCKIDGVTLRNTDSTYLGFSTGDWMPVQAEAHARHVQLGRISPDYLLFTDTAKMYPAGASSWAQMNVNYMVRDSTVWNFSKPDPDGFWVNTDANH